MFLIDPSSNTEKMPAVPVSVAMCTRNGAKYLSTQLRSIANQTMHPSELIVCDDASGDGTLHSAEEFARSVPFPVRVYSNEVALGPAKNFEKAISLCDGEIIILADQDDEWMPKKIEKFSKVFGQNPEVIYAFSNAEFIDESGRSLETTLWDAVGLEKSLRRFNGDRQLEILLRHNIITGAAMAFRASFRETFLPIADGWMHDYWIVLLASLFSSGIPVPECLFRYRQHQAQVCGWKKKTFLEVMKNSLDTDKEDWNRKIERFESLLTHIASIKGTKEIIPSRLELIYQKELHLKRRARARSSRGIVRVARTIAEATTGRYQRFSNSWYSLARDL